MARRFTYYANQASVPTGIWTFISRSSVAGSNGGTTTSINTSTANLIVAEVASYYPSAEPTFSDNKGNTWILLTRHFDSSLISSNRIYYCINPTVGSGHTFTLSGASSFSNMNVMAFNNTITPTYHAENGSSDIGNLNYIHTGAVTNSLANALVIVGFSALNSGVPPITIDSGIIQVDSFYNGGFYISGTGGYKILSSITTINPRFDWNNQTYVSTSIALFQ
jgi:hypothetical protein